MVLGTSCLGLASVAVQATCYVPDEFAFWLRVEGRGSRVEGRGSRVTSRGSRVNGRGSRVNGRGSKNYSKLFLNYFLTSSTQKFTGSCLLEFLVPVFAAFGSYFCLPKTFTFPASRLAGYILILWAHKAKNILGNPGVYLSNLFISE